MDSPTADVADDPVRGLVRAGTAAVVQDQVLAVLSRDVDECLAEDGALRLGEGGTVADHAHVLGGLGA